MIVPIITKAGIPSVPSVCSLGEVTVTVQNGIGVNPADPAPSSPVWAR